MKRILITGKGTSGSWHIRGVQLGDAIGATVIPNASASQMAAHDLVVLVKRPTPALLDCLEAARKPVVWDVVDSQPQPEANQWRREEAIRWLRASIKQIKPCGLVCATEQMLIDAEHPRSIALPHHARPNQAFNPIREQVQTIGYEGRPDYLADWIPIIQQECARRGWRFVVNPERMADIDIVVALRGGIWRGYVTDNYKSGVKLANAQATGTPFIGLPENGYLTNASGAEYFVSDKHQFARALDWLTPQMNRRAASERMLGRDNSLARIAGVYRDWLESL